MDDVTRLRTLIARNQVELGALQQRYGGLQALFNSHAMRSNGAGMDDLREQVHACVDEILDTSASSFMLTTQLMEAMTRKG